MKKIITVLAMLFTSAVLFAGENFHFSISPVYKLQNGILNEYVLYNDSNGQCQKLSELNWNIKNLSSMGCTAALNWKWVEISGSISGTFPKNSGFMYDSDWQNYSDTTMKTNYSISTNTVSSAYNASFAANANFAVLDWLSIKPFVKYNLYYNYFVSKDAEGWYGDKYNSKTGDNVSYDDENAAHYSVGQLCSIDYSRTEHNICIGLGLGFNILNKVNINGKVGAAPFNYVTSVDTHWSNKNKTSGSDYNDRMPGYFNCYFAELTAELVVTSFLNIGIGGDYNYTHLIKGLTYQKAHSSENYPSRCSTDSYAGCSGYYWDLSAFVKIHF